MSKKDTGPPVMFDVPGIVRRARRVADLSQMELADRLGVAQSSVARWESGKKLPSLERLQQVLALARLTLIAVTEDGMRVPPMRSDAVRDLRHRRFPAHLDVFAAEITDHMGGPISQLGRAPRRLRRDRRRAIEDRQGGNAEDAVSLPERFLDDHVTEADVHATRHERLARRKDQARHRRQAVEDARRARGIPPSRVRCLCVDGCYLDCFCVRNCPCQCDPAPGWDWGDTCALPRRSPPDR